MMEDFIKGAARPQSLSHDFAGRLEVSPT
jgi:hypothetical protein